MDFSIFSAPPFFTFFGFLVGTVGTFIGVGGGFAIIPFFIVTLSLEPAYAVGTSLVIIFLNALSGTISYSLQKRINYKIGIYFALASLPGAVAGWFILQYIDKNFFKVLFSVLLALAAVYIFFSRNGERLEKSGELNKKKVFCGTIISFFVGVISTILGIGGGIIHIPVMLFILAMPTHSATATSHFILTITSFAGTIIFLYHNQIIFNIVLFTGIGVVMGAQVGGIMSAHSRGGFIKKIFAIALFLVSCELLKDAISRSPN